MYNDLVHFHRLLREIIMCPGILVKNPTAGMPAGSPQLAKVLQTTPGYLMTGEKWTKEEREERIRETVAAFMVTCEEAGFDAEIMPGGKYVVLRGNRKTLKIPSKEILRIMSETTNYFVYLLSRLEPSNVL